MSLKIGKRPLLDNQDIDTSNDRIQQSRKFKLNETIQAKILKQQQLEKNLQTLTSMFPDQQNQKLKDLLESLDGKLELAIEILQNENQQQQDSNINIRQQCQEIIQQKQMSSNINNTYRIKKIIRPKGAIQIPNQNNQINNDNNIFNVQEIENNMHSIQNLQSNEQQSNQNEFNSQQNQHLSQKQYQSQSQKISQQQQQDLNNLDQFMTVQLIQSLQQIKSEEEAAQVIQAALKYYREQIQKDQSQKDKDIDTLKRAFLIQYNKYHKLQEQFNKQSQVLESIHQQLIQSKNSERNYMIRLALLSNDKQYEFKDLHIR